MLRRRILGIGMAAVMCATTLGVVNTTHAHAAFTHVEECQVSGTWTFGPALTSYPLGAGDITINYSGWCFDAVTGAFTRSIPPTTGGANYTGGCESAVLTPTGVLVGGTSGTQFAENSSQANYSEITLSPRSGDPCHDDTADMTATVIEYHF